MVEVEVYTNKGCPACVSVKHYLDRKGIDYVEKRLGKSRKTDIEFAVRTKNSKKIPQVFIGGEWIGGFDDVVRFDKAGELDWRLGLVNKPKVGLLQKIIRFLKGEKY
mgnify:FL=1|jgi:glutaredoxin 3|tara:strand:- start:5545 stop:5865 length:321 start_codon:yes stop_codon:yes gene_type:complete